MYSSVPGSLWHLGNIWNNLCKLTQSLPRCHRHIFNFLYDKPATKPTISLPFLAPSSYSAPFWRLVTPALRSRAHRALPGFPSGFGRRALQQTVLRRQPGRSARRRSASSRRRRAEHGRPAHPLTNCCWLRANSQIRAGIGCAALPYVPISSAPLHRSISAATTTAGDPQRQLPRCCFQLLGSRWRFIATKKSPSTPATLCMSIHTGSLQQHPACQDHGRRAQTERVPHGLREALPSRQERLGAQKDGAEGAGLRSRSHRRVTERFPARERWRRGVGAAGPGPGRGLGAGAHLGLENICGPGAPCPRCCPYSSVFSGAVYSWVVSADGYFSGQSPRPDIRAASAELAPCRSLGLRVSERLRSQRLGAWSSRVWAAAPLSSGVFNRSVCKACFKGKIGKAAEVPTVAESMVTPVFTSLGSFLTWG